MLYPIPTSNYLDEMPHYLNYKYRFNHSTGPLYNTITLPTITNVYNDFSALKEQYIPFSKYL